MSVSTFKTMMYSCLIFKRCPIVEQLSEANKGCKYFFANLHDMLTQKTYFVDATFIVYRLSTN